MEELLYSGRKYVLDSIKSLCYPIGHPFLDGQFEKDIVFHMLTLLKLYIHENNIIDDFLKKLKANKDGNFIHAQYFEALGEVTFFYYLFIGLLENKYLSKVYNIIYEPENIFENNKKLEYSFTLITPEQNLDMINFEVKTISCDPFLREDNINLNNGMVLVKPFFNDVEINEEFIKEEIPEFILLESSTHLRQLKKNIKKIISKYEGEKRLPYKMINVGVFIVQFATSLEEFYAYLLHPTKGILFNMEFGNLDALVFFSLTSRTELDMSDIYNGNHLFSICLNNDRKVLDYLRMFRLDNFVAVESKVNNNFTEYANREYGAYRVVNKEGFLFVVPYHTSVEAEMEYIRYVRGENPNYYTDLVRK